MLLKSFDGRIISMGIVASIFARSETVHFLIVGMLKDEVYSSNPRTKDSLKKGNQHVMSSTALAEL
jgi:hypothetical protein